MLPKAPTLTITVSSSTIGAEIVTGKPTLPRVVTDYLSSPITARRLVEGSSNELWGLATPSGHWVWRQDAPASRTPGVDRARERTVLETLATQPWAPRVHLWTDQGLLMPFYQGTAPETPQLAPAHRSALLDALTTLWQLPLDWPPYDYHEMVSDYASNAPDDTINRDRAARLQAGCADWPDARPRLTHHDLHADNLLFHQGRWMLLDWEYAAPGNPWLDAVSVDRWLGFTDREKARIETALADWALPGDSWQTYHAWIRDLEALWYAARGE